MAPDKLLSMAGDAAGEMTMDVCCFIDSLAVVLGLKKQPGK